MAFLSDSSKNSAMLKAIIFMIIGGISITAVSYTHLTLPTICSV